MIENVFVKNAALIFFEKFLCLRIDGQGPWPVEVIHLVPSHLCLLMISVRTGGVDRLKRRSDGGGEGR